MSISNVQEVAIRNEIRLLRRDLNRLMAQMSTFIKNNTVITNHSTLQQLDYASSGHTGFASTASLTAHTGDSTIHFTEASIDHDNITNQDNNKHVHVGGSEPAGDEILWLDTSPAAPYSTLELKLSGDGGSTWQRVGIGW